MTAGRGSKWWHVIAWRALVVADDHHARDSPHTMTPVLLCYGGLINSLLPRDKKLINSHVDTGR